MKFCTKKLVIMGFFADWCPHCVTFKPKFEEAQERSEKLNLPVVWHTFKDDTKDGRAAMKEYEVKGFPSIRMYLCKTDQVVTYTGKRTSEALLEFVESYIGDTR